MVSSSNTVSIKIAMATAQMEPLTASAFGKQATGNGKSIEINDSSSQRLPDLSGVYQSGQPSMGRKVYLYLHGWLICMVN